MTILSSNNRHSKLLIRSKRRKSRSAWLTSRLTKWTRKKIARTRLLFHQVLSNNLLLPWTPSWWIIRVKTLQISTQLSLSTSRFKSIKGQLTSVIRPHKFILQHKGALTHLTALVQELRVDVNFELKTDEQVQSVRWGFTKWRISILQSEDPRMYQLLEKEATLVIRQEIAQHQSLKERGRLRLPLKWMQVSDWHFPLTSQDPVLSIWCLKALKMQDGSAIYACLTEATCFLVTS